ncbi:hypothetical protein Pcac1_g29156 [Phytophthora cactorum]|nr:hypothetical protein Pcac1_g29156 [Phytophthora cactorum]
MEDVFDGGRREYAPKEVLVDLHDEDATDEEVSSGSDRNEDEDEDEAARDEDFEPGSKATPRTQSLEEAVEVPSAKRQSRHQTLDEMSAAAQESQDFEAAYVVDSVGEMPTTFKSAMESQRRNQVEGRRATRRWSLFTRTRRGSSYRCRRDARQSATDGVSSEGEPSRRDRAVQGATGGQGISAKVRHPHGAAGRVHR